MDKIKYSGKAVRDDQLMKDCSEIAVTIENKKVFVSEALVGSDAWSKLVACVKDPALADRMQSLEAVELELPAEFALANGLSLPASETGATTLASSDVSLAPGGPAPKPDDTVSSTSDQRTVNNVMRHEYRVLTDDEKAQMQSVKDLGKMFLDELDVIVASTPAPAGAMRGSRELSIARTKIEEAVMWAVKHITA